MEVMKIITWNCNGGFRNKLAEIDKLNADILVIQECENPALSTVKYKDWAGEYLWVGESKNKGIGVFPKKGNSVSHLKFDGEFKITGLTSSSKTLTWSTSSLRLFLPFSINENIQALGVWTKGSDSEAFGYMGQFWKYLQIHRNDFKREKQLILGDFNSNKIWDKKDRWWNHSNVVAELEEIGLVSLYHHHFNEDQGVESSPTLFLQRNAQKPYHIDYVFVSKDYLDSEIKIGQRERWLSLSDHMPIEIGIHS